MNKGLCPKCRKVISSASEICEHCGTEIRLDNIPIETRREYPITKVYEKHFGLQIGSAVFCIGGGLIMVFGLAPGFSTGEFNGGLIIFGLLAMLPSLFFTFRANRYWLQMLLEHEYAMLTEGEKAQLAGAEAMPQSQPSTTVSAVQELRQLKALLDEGIITQEEFDAKKRQLLDL